MDMDFRCERLVVPVITPRQAGHVDIAGLIRLLEYLVEGKVNSLFVLGTTGEFQYLDIAEKMRVIESSARWIDGRVPLLVGISSRSAEETIRLAKAAAANGAQAVVLAPMFGWGEPANPLQRVIGTISLPLLLYNNPEIHEQTMLPLDVVRSYAGHAKITGIKDSSGDGDYFRELINLRSETFTVLQGKESQILQSLHAGADGIVAGAANVDPQPFVEILNSPDEETMNRIMDLKSELKALSPDSIRAVKQKLVQSGIIGSAEMFGD